MTMDVYCKQCGEPWDVDSLHEIAGDRHEHEVPMLEYSEVFDAVYEDFRKRGCAVLHSRHNDEKPAPVVLAMLTAIDDLVGDDLDAAAMFGSEAFEFMDGGK